MAITSANLGKTITTKYTLKEAQRKPETTAYFVVEHQPAWCRAYPSSGVAFQQIHVEVDNKLVAAPAWKTAQERPKCGCKSAVVSPQEIVFSWNTSDAGEDSAAFVTPSEHLHSKWGLGLPLTSGMK